MTQPNSVSKLTDPIIMIALIVSISALITGVLGFFNISVWYKQVSQIGNYILNILSIIGGLGLLKLIYLATHAKKA